MLARLTVDGTRSATGFMLALRPNALAAVAAAALALTACGSSTSPAESYAVTQAIGPAGGTMLVDGATITFPAGALAETKQITITATANQPPEGFVAISKVYECGPTGTSFAQPVTMAMPFEGDATGATMFWSSGADPAFKDVGGTREGNLMKAEVRHFSSGFVGRKK